MVPEDISPAHGVLGPRGNFLRRLGWDKPGALLASISEELNVSWGIPSPWGALAESPCGGALTPGTCGEA